jgi:hypothetical protein
MRAAGVGAGEAGASDIGGDLLDCTKVIIIDIPIFKKNFLSKRRRAVARGPPESGTFDAPWIAAGKSPIG